MSMGIDETFYEWYLAALLAGDRPQCTDLVSRLLEKEIRTEVVYTQLFQRSLYRIGELWEHNRISVAVEHLATAITESLLATVYPRILAGRSPGGRKAVISCSVNEYHQVGARMVADIMEGQGWDAWFLGANTPVEDLLRLIEEKKPDILGLSVSIYFNMAPLKKMIQVVRSHYAGLDILVGGQAFRWGGREVPRMFPKTTFLPSLEELTCMIGPESGS